ncbi:DNA-directed RNA polymerase subunit alpha C-terminal domain-containing protein [Gemmatimonadota bacterium]
MPEHESSISTVEQILQRDLLDLPLSVRTVNLLMRYGIPNLGEFLRRPRAEVRNLKGMQNKVWNEIGALLAEHGLDLEPWQ